MSLTLRIALTYIKSSRRRGFISFISGISILGLILSVMSLITVLSVMNGFQDELKNRILSAISHGFVSHIDNQFPQDSAVLDSIKKHPNVIAVSPYIEQYALLNYQSQSKGAVVRGIDTNLENTTSDLLKQIKYGTNTLLKKDHLILGIGLANELGLSIGDKVTLFTPKIANAIIGILPRFKRFLLVGIFDLGTQEYNDNLAIIRLDSAQILYQLPNQINGYRLKFNQVLEANNISNDINSTIDNAYYAVSWMQQKQNLIRALHLEKMMIGVILFFIIAIAAFNLVSMMIMVVMEKRSDIAILGTMGLTRAKITKIFFYQSLLISILGIIIGLILGVLLTFNLDMIINLIEFVFNIEIFPQDIFYVSKLPTSLQFLDIVFTASLALVLSILSALYPAIRAAKTNIAQILRCE